MSKEVRSLTLACPEQQKKTETLKSLAFRDLEQAYRIIAEELKEAGGLFARRTQAKLNGYSSAAWSLWCIPAGLDTGRK